MSKSGQGARPARGLWSSGYQPSRDKYKCVVNNCKAQKIRGDDITKHFQNHSNLLALDQANEHQSDLRKRFSASDAVTVPDEFLKNPVTILSNRILV